MKFIIPIQNINIEEISKAGSTIFIPRFFLDEIENHRDSEALTAEEFDEVIRLLEICGESYSEKYNGYVVAIFEHEFSDEEYYRNVPANEFVFLEQLCYKLDRTLDYLRLNLCSFGKREYLIGVPGIIGNFQRGIVVNTENSSYRELLGHVFNIYTKPGIGLAEGNITVHKGSEEERMFFNKRSDAVYCTCRSALARVNESLYFNNLNTSFVYLMSTLEMLENPEKYTQFGKVKTRVASFVATSKIGYHEECGKLRNASENVRTEIVHKGKSLFDIYNSEKEIIKLLDYLMFTIYRYCENVIDTGIEDFESLKVESTKRIAQFS